jgi:hypothetical protein
MNNLANRAKKNKTAGLAHLRQENTTSKCYAHLRGGTPNTNLVVLEMTDIILTTSFH